MVFADDGWILKVAFGCSRRKEVKWRFLSWRISGFQAITGEGLPFYQRSCYGGERFNWKVVWAIVAEV